MDFADLVSPLGTERFMADHFGRNPVHIPANRTTMIRPLIDWPRLNALLDIRSHWSEANLKLILDNRAVYPSLYLDPEERPGGSIALANPAKVQVFLGMGASLVANFVEDVAPEVREVTSSLEHVFGARAGANLYCSFEAIQAFPSHCDLHEVFALQCEGEKVWNLYEQRAASPIQTLFGDDAQAVIDAAKGRVAMQVRMQPGDVLYIPRGFYHDALASSEASLHITFSVAPLTAQVIFDLLKEECIADEAFRSYLHDGRNDTEGLQRQLGTLADRTARWIRSPAFAVAIRHRQQQLHRQPAPFSLPGRMPLTFYVRSQLPAQVRSEGEVSLLSHARGEMASDQPIVVIEWILQRRGFAAEELRAAFPYIEVRKLDKLLLQLKQAGLIQLHETAP